MQQAPNDQFDRFRGAVINLRR